MNLPYQEMVNCGIILDPRKVSVKALDFLYHNTNNEP